MKLTAHDKQSALWLRLRAHLQERMAVYQRKNEGDLSPDETTKLRGRIAQVKEILALDEPVQADSTVDAEATNGHPMAGFSQE